VKPHLLKMPHGGQVDFAEMAAERLGYPFRLCWKVANLDRLVAVFFHRLLLDDGTRAGLHDSDGDRPSCLIEDLSHPYLPT
jgi:hypothetical protein